MKKSVAQLESEIKRLKKSNLSTRNKIAALDKEIIHIEGMRKGLDRACEVLNDVFNSLNEHKDRLEVYKKNL